MSYMLVCPTQQQMEMQRRNLFLSVLTLSLILLYQATSIGLAPAYSKEGEDGKHGQGGHSNTASAGKQSAGTTTTNSFTSTTTTAIGAHSQVEIEASGKVSGGSLDGANVKVEVNAKFGPDGTFKEGRIKIKIQKADTKIELNVPASSDSHLHPPATGDHTSLSGCEVPNPSAHIVSNMATVLNIQVIGGTGTSHVALQGLSPIIGSYSDLLCLSGMTQIAGK